MLPPSLVRYAVTLVQAGRRGGTYCVRTRSSRLGYNYGVTALAAAPVDVVRPRGSSLHLMHLRGDQAGRFVVPSSDAVLDRVAAGGATVEVDTLAGLAHQHFASALLFADSLPSAASRARLRNRVSAFVRRVHARRDDRGGMVREAIAR